MKKIVLGVLIAALIAGCTCIGINAVKLNSIISEKNEKGIELQQIIEENRRDYSTGLLNKKNYKIEAVEKIRSLQEGEQAVLINLSFASLDRGLKYVNDTYGHIAGAQSIKDFANTLKSVFPEDKFILSHRAASTFDICTTGNFTDEELLAYYNEFKSKWHDTPYKVYGKDATIEGMACLFTCAVIPDAIPALDNLSANDKYYLAQDYIRNGKVEIREISNCEYKIIRTPQENKN